MTRDLSLREMPETQNIYQQKLQTLECSWSKGPVICAVGLRDSAKQACWSRDDAVMLRFQLLDVALQVRYGPC